MTTIYGPLRRRCLAPSAIPRASSLLRWPARGATLLLMLALLPAPAARAQDSPETLVLRGGWLFDGVSGEAVRNTGIVIRGGKFLEVGADLAGRDLAGARVIDVADDQYVLPGLFDLHAHYNINLFGTRRRDEVVVNPVVFLANGVTSTFPAGEYDPEDMFALRRRIDRGEVPGPRLFNAGPYYGSARPGWSDEITADSIRAEVDRWAARGAAGFKAKGIRPEHLRVLIERAHRHGLTVTGHLDSGFRGSVNPRDAILMGIDRIEHFLGGDALPATRPAYASLVALDLESADFRAIVALYLKHRVYYDATITAYGYYGDRADAFDYWTDERRFFTPFVREHLARNPRTLSSDQFRRIHYLKRREIKAFYDAGGGDLITLGTDYPSNGEFVAGFSAHRELHAFVLSGIPPAAALKIATINGARALGAGDRLGTIEPGKLADLFVVQGNPLDDIRNTRNVRLVVKAGVVYDPAALLAGVEGMMGPRTAEEAADW